MENLGSPFCKVFEMVRKLLERSSLNMKTKIEMHCICCDAGLESVHEDADCQPKDGVCASSFGNYGSTAFDSIDGKEEIFFFVCDTCLRNRKHRIYLRRHSEFKLEPVGDSIS